MELFYHTNMRVRDSYDHSLKYPIVTIDLDNGLLKDYLIEDGEGWKNQANEELMASFKVLHNKYGVVTHEDGLVEIFIKAEGKGYLDVVRDLPLIYEFLLMNNLLFIKNIWGF